MARQAAIRENLLDAAEVMAVHWRRRWRDGRVAEGAGLLNRFPNFSLFVKNTNITNGFNGFVRVLIFAPWHVVTVF